MKRFRTPVQPRDQVVLVPTSLEDAIPQDAPVRIFHELVQALDCTTLLASYRGGGAPAYHPVLLLEVLLFAYNEGIRSSRPIARLLTYDLRFQYLAEGQRPDFRTISAFRKDHAADLAALCTGVVRLAMDLGLVVLEHVACDGTKVEAVASREASYTEERLARALVQAQARLQQILEEAAATDAAEEATPVSAVPEALATARQRLARLQALAQARTEAGVRGPSVATEPESGVIKTRAGKRPAYNVQAAVDAAAQIVVGVAVTASAADNHQAPTLLAAIEETTGCRPTEASMDGGYWSPETVAAADTRGIALYLPPQGGDAEARGFRYDAGTDTYQCAQGEALTFQRERVDKGRPYRIYRCACRACPVAAACHGTSKRHKEVWRRQWTPEEAAHREKMATPDAQATYRRRAQTVEPVFGQWKQLQRFTRFLLRGVSGALLETQLVAMAHNLRKCAQVWRLQPREG